MPSFTAFLPKIKYQRKLLVYALIAVLILVIIGGYFVFQGTERIGQFNFSEVLSKLTASLVQKKVTVSEEGVSSEELQLNLPATPSNNYEETAEPGEGIAHLARKALSHYLKDSGEELNLTPEHKIYIEDYMQKKTGERWLKIGEKITFSKELIEEAISKAQQLTPQQLEHLKIYSSQVKF